MSKNRHISSFLFFCFLVGWFFFILYGISLRYQQLNFPIEAYWASFVLTSVPLLFEVVSWKNNSKLRLFYLLSFGLMIHLQYVIVDFSPIISSPDAIADLRLSQKIMSEGIWNPLGTVTWSFATEYILYPITDFIYTTLSLITQIPLFLIVKYLFIIKVVTIPLLYFIFKRFFSERIAYFASFLFLASPGAILFPHKETFALIFFFLGLYAILNLKTDLRFLIIYFISIPLLVMTHHFTTYIFFVILIVLYVINYLFKSRNEIKISSRLFLFSLIIFVVWVAFISTEVFSYHQQLLSDMFFRVLLPGQLNISELLPQYVLYEQVITYVGIGVAVISASFGLITYFKKRNISSPSLFAITLSLIPILVIALFFRFYPSSSFSILISHRAFEFGYIIIGVFSSLFFVQFFQKKKSKLSFVLVIGIVFMLLFGLMTNSIHPRGFIRLSEINSNEAISMNNWMKDTMSQGEYIIGDSYVVSMLVYGDFITVIAPEWYMEENVYLERDLSFPQSEAEYVITYSYMTDLYGDNAEKFIQVPVFQNIYSCESLNLYRIADR